MKLSDEAANRLYRTTRENARFTYRDICLEEEIGHRQLYNRMHDFGAHYHKYRSKQGLMLTRTYATERKARVTLKRDWAQIF